MKFNAYFVELDHHEPSFTGNILIQGKSFSVNFKKIENRLFSIFFKKQIQLLFGEKIDFKNRQKQIRVLLPVLSKYNKRKLKKITHIIKESHDMSERDIILNLLNIEKFLRVERLLNFFSLEKEKVTEFLIEMEQSRRIKIIDFNSLYIVSYDHFQNYLKELKSLFQYLYENRIKAIKFSEIESKIKISQSSIFFKYLLSSFDYAFSFKILKDKILLEKVSLSEKEKKIISMIESILKKNKLTVFSIENVLKLGRFKYQEVNNSLWYLVEEGDLVQLNNECFMFSTDLTKILNRLKKYKRNEGEIIDIQSFRELTLFNRKSIITLLEYLDSQNITRRMGNKRQILLTV